MVRSGGQTRSSSVREGITLSEGRRTRDPQRRERILSAATALFSRYGYQSVNLNDIGTEAGIVGSGIYRHFDSKAAILIELLDRVIDKLNADAAQTVREEDDPLIALVSMLSAQIRVTLDDRHLYRVYVQESRHLPVEDLERLRMKQRLYVSRWQQVLLATRSELTPEQARVTIHAAISVAHSVLRYHPALPPDELHDLLLEIGCRTLGIDHLLQERGKWSNGAQPAIPRPASQRNGKGSRAAAATEAKKAKAQ